MASPPALRGHGRRQGHTTVRIDKGTAEALRALASEDQVPMQRLLAQLVEQYRRQRILDQTSAAYAALRADPDAWREEQEERALWDHALMDGIEDE